MEKLFLGGSILTMTDMDLNTGIKNCAVYVKDGIIAAIDDKDKIMARVGEYCELVDLHRCSLVPGFIVTYGSFLQSVYSQEESDFQDKVKKTDKKYLSYGITTATEKCLTEDMAKAYRKICNEDLSKLDIVAYASYENKGCGWRDKTFKVLEYECPDNYDIYSDIDVMKNVLNHKNEVYDTLKAFTINAAKRCSEEKLKGSIEIGKIADLVILSHNPLMCSENELKNIRVLATVKNGRFVV